jgi:hypothetical protein
MAKTRRQISTLEEEEEEIKAPRFYICSYYRASNKDKNIPKKKNI